MVRWPTLIALSRTARIDVRAGYRNEDIEIYPKVNPGLPKAQSHEWGRNERARREEEEDWSALAEGANWGGTQE
jgi:hypothetical protein